MRGLGDGTGKVGGIVTGVRSGEMAGVVPAMTRRLLPLCLALSILLPSCGDMTKGKALADAAVTDFHRQFNEGKFSALYKAADPGLKAASPEADFLKLLEAVDRKLGKHLKSTETGWQVKTFNTTTTAVLTEQSEFEHGTGTETFTYVISGGSGALKAYFINSTDMITK